MRFLIGRFGLALVVAAAHCGCVPPGGGSTRSRIVMTHSISVQPDAPFKMPLKGKVRLLSEFGQRGRRPHTGVDLRCSKGSGDPVLAARAGRVMAVGWVRGYGRQAVIEHSDGYRTRYAHMKTVSVSLGQRVKEEQVIGKVGSTGRASGPHLHFEVLTPDGKFIDPLLFLPKNQFKK